MNKADIKKCRIIDSMIPKYGSETHTVAGIDYAIVDKGVRPNYQKYDCKMYFGAHRVECMKKDRKRLIQILIDKEILYVPVEAG